MLVTVIDPYYFTGEKREGVTFLHFMQSKSSFTKTFNFYISYPLFAKVKSLFTYFFGFASRGEAGSVGRLGLAGCGSGRDTMICNPFGN
jgi:hypothetical protein